MISISAAQQSLYTSAAATSDSRNAQADKAWIASGVSSATNTASSTYTKISQEAQAALAASQSSSASVEARLAEIQGKDIISRTAEDVDFQWANDPGLVAIKAKMDANPNYSPTAAELDHEQKVGGFVNTMANLSQSEKDLYDKAIASGNKEAAAGISQIAFIRMMGHTAGGAPGTTYDPLNTAITPENINKYFSYSIVDPTGKAQSQFQALIQFLQSTQAEA